MSNGYDENGVIQFEKDKIEEENFINLVPGDVGKRSSIWGEEDAAPYKRVIMELDGKITNLAHDSENYNLIGKI